MGKILAEYPSKSNPAVRHQIIEGRDGVIYCTCTAWKMKKNCKHLISYSSNFGTEIITIDDLVVKDIAVLEDTAVLGDINKVTTKGLLNRDWS